MIAWVAPASRSMRSRHRHDARRAVDGEAAAGIVRQRVGDAVGGRIAIRGEGGDADGGADRRVLCDCIGGSIRIRRGRDVELVDVGHRAMANDWFELDPSCDVAVTPIVIVLSVSPIEARTGRNAHLAGRGIDHRTGRPASLARL